MAERYVVRERIRIYYESKRLATGLTDVKIDIIKTDGNKEIDQAAMLELSDTNAPGIYYYDWVPTNAGTYLTYIDSLSDEYKRTMTGTISVVGRSSKYTQVMGVHGGMSTNRVTVRDTWTEKEKSDLLQAVDKLAKKYEVLVASVNGLDLNISDQKSKSLILKDEYDKFKDSIKLNQISSMEQINSRVNTVGDRVEMSIAKQTVSNNLMNNNIKSLNEKFISLNDKVEQKLQSQIDELKAQNKILLESININNSKYDEISDSLKQNCQLFLKFLPTEKLIEVENGH